MTPGQRTTYFRLWGEACKTNGWSQKDQAKRQSITADCMTAVRGPAVVSSTDLGEDEITAIFYYLEYLATGGGDLDASARWLDCQQDYQAFNRARQADWHESKTYGGAGSKKLSRDRFNGERSAVGEPLEKFDPKAIKKRHLTFATRHQKKAKEAGLPKPTAANTAAAPEFPVGNGRTAPVAPATSTRDRAVQREPEFDPSAPFG